MDRRRLLLGGGALLGVALTSGAAQQGDGMDSDGLSSLAGPLVGDGADDDPGDDGDGAGTSDSGRSDEDGRGGDEEGDAGSSGTSDDGGDGGNDSGDGGNDSGDGGNDSGDGGNDSGDGGNDSGDGGSSGDGPIPGFSASTVKAEASADGVDITDVERKDETGGLRFRTAAADEAALRDDLESVLAAISAAIEDADAFDGGVETVVVDVYHVERDESRESAIDPRAAIDYRNGDISMDGYLERV